MLAAQARLNGWDEMAVEVWIYQHEAMPCDGVAKRRGDAVVVLVRAGLNDGQRTALLELLLTADEFAAVRRDDGERAR